jgi:hypothetical protein
MGRSGGYKLELSINIVSDTPLVPHDYDVDVRCRG